MLAEKALRLPAAVKVTAAVIIGWCDMISIGPGQGRGFGVKLASRGDRLGD